MRLRPPLPRLWSFRYRWRVSEVETPASALYGPRVRLDVEIVEVATGKVIASSRTRDYWPTRDEMRRAGREALNEARQVQSRERTKARAKSWLGEWN